VVKHQGLYKRDKKICGGETFSLIRTHYKQVESSWNVMANGDARERKRGGNWRMEWVASTLHTTSEHGVSSITTADAHTSPASSRMYWRPHRFKWTRPFRRKTKSGFCACAITFQLGCTTEFYVFCRFNFLSGYENGFYLQCREFSPNVSCGTEYNIYKVWN